MAVEYLGNHKFVVFDCFERLEAANKKMKYTQKAPGRWNDGCYGPGQKWRTGFEGGLGEMTWGFCIGMEPDLTVRHVTHDFTVNGLTHEVKTSKTKKLQVRLQKEDGTWIGLQSDLYIALSLDVIFWEKQRAELTLRGVITRAELEARDTVPGDGGDWLNKEIALDRLSSPDPFLRADFKL